MFGFIKKLIAGILNFITGLFAKKDNSYFLELKEEATEAVATATAKVKSATVESVKAAAAKVESMTTEAEKTEPAKAPATKAKSAKGKAGKAKTEPAKAPAPTETAFATKYLMPLSSSNGRRRPGANMNSYLDMARQMKTPG